METIAVIDDEVYIGDMIEEVLRREGYAVLRAYSGTEALFLLQQKKPALILLDLMLPGASGEEVLAAIKGLMIPVIVISAKADVEDKVHVLLDGASDYLTKPFEIKELLARITVQLRSVRAGSAGKAGEDGKADANAGESGDADGADVSARESGNKDGEDATARESRNKDGAEVSARESRNKGGQSGQDGGCRTSGDKLIYRELTLDIRMREVYVGEAAVHLTRTEYAILKYLMQNPGQVLTKTQILERISEDTPDCMESSLKVHVSNLRKKLSAAGDTVTGGAGTDGADAKGRDYIESVWGIGFKLAEE